MSSVSPKGQVTIPLTVRKRLGLKPRDKVAFLLDDDTVRIAAAKSRVNLSYQVIPALGRSLTDQELTDIAWEDHAEHVAREDLNAQ